jgi:predicted ATPase/DNA-binding winged helix-turn-helix (wHTH) protein
MTDSMVEYRFDRFVVEPDRRRLLVDGEPAKIGARAFDILLVLIKRRARVVSKNELLDLIWPGTAIEPGNLQVHIFALRKLLGAGAIATVPGRGYQFTSVIEGQQSAVTDTHPHPPSPTQALPGNLPSHLAALYGRDVDLAKLATLIAQHRLVSVVGPGGIGKTRLAQMVARERRGVDGDGAWLVELAQIATPDLIVPTIARVLGQTLGSNTVSSFVDVLNQQELLLVLDNCEHLIDPLAELAGAILTEAPKVKLLVTSQEPLRLDEEQVYRLGSLVVPPEADVATALDHSAVALFVARAQAADGRFELDEDNVDAVVEICRGLDGIPLALELAAARVSLLGVHGVHRRLNERLRLLSGGSRKALPRHRALSAALQWSYGLLSDDERHVLDQLGILVGEFPLETARYFLADDRMDEWSALEHLSTLVDKSLLIVEPGELPRYRLLETTRAFALERVTAKGTIEEIRRKHAVAMIATLRSHSFNQSPLARAEHVAPDMGNLLAAATWAIGPSGNREIAIELVAEAGHIWYVLGYNDEGANLFRCVEPWVDASTRPELAARFWVSRSRLYHAAMRTAAEDGTKAANIFRRLGCWIELFDALINVTLQLNRAGDSASAEAALVEAKTLLDENWPFWTRVAFEFASGSAKYWAGALDDARRLLLAAIELSRGHDNVAIQTEQMELVLLGCDVAARRSYDAVRAGRDMLERANPRIRGFNRVIVEGLWIAALIQIGELAKADSSLREAFPRIRRALGTGRTTLCYVSFLLARQGRCADATRLLGAIDALRPVGSPILAPPNRSAYEDSKTIAVEALGRSEFERLKAEGLNLSEDEAVMLWLPDKSDYRSRQPS